MGLRQWLLENVAGDLEYNPRRAAVYPVLGVLALASCVFARGRAEYSFVPSVPALGGLALVAKAVFMFRKQSAGLGTTEESLLGSSGPPVPTTPVPLATDSARMSLPERAAQLMQDFAIGPLLLSPLISVGANTDGTGLRPRVLPVFMGGALLYAAGWLLCRLTRHDFLPRA